MERLTTDSHRNNADKPMWVSAEERLPESPGRYLTVSSVPKYGVRVVDVLRFAGAWIWRGNLEIIVTHWMPLPEPPKEGK